MEVCKRLWQMVSRRFLTRQRASTLSLACKRSIITLTSQGCVWIKRAVLRAHRDLSGLCRSWWPPQAIWPHQVQRGQPSMAGFSQSPSGSHPFGAGAYPAGGLLQTSPCSCERRPGFRSFLTLSSLLQLICAPPSGLHPLFCFLPVNLQPTPNLHLINLIYIEHPEKAPE